MSFAQGFVFGLYLTHAVSGTVDHSLHEIQAKAAATAGVENVYIADFEPNFFKADDFKNVLQLSQQNSSCSFQYFASLDENMRLLRSGQLDVNPEVANQIAKLAEDQHLTAIVSSVWDGQRGDRATCENENEFYVYAVNGHVLSMKFNSAK